MVAAGPALSAVSRDCRRACVARGRRWAGSLRSVQRLQKGPWRAWSPLGRLSPQCPETAEGPAARVVAAGPALSTVSRDCRRACGARGRRWAGSLRSVQRLQKGLRRAWSPLGRLSPQCPETAEGPVARVVAAGPAFSAVSRDCMRVCGARGRRWAGSLRSVQRLQKGLRRAWSPLGRLSLQWPALSAVSRDCRRVCGACGRSPQCPETAEGPAVSRDWRRACGAPGRRWAGSLRSVQRLEKGLPRAWSLLGRLSLQWPFFSECPETAEGPAARVVAAGPALSAVSRGCMRVCGARGRRWAGSLRSVQRRPQYPETAEGPPARVVAAGPPAVLCVTAIVISIVLVLAGLESHCKCCEKDVCEVCLCTGAIVICRTSVCAACESPCKCCIEVVCENTGVADTLTHSLTHSRTHSLTHSLIHSLTHSFTHSLTDALTHSLTHSLTHGEKLFVRTERRHSQPIVYLPFLVGFSRRPMLQCCYQVWALTFLVDGGVLFLC